ncbi:MAG: hypothetical protein AAFV53_23325 [Myxococcota bacterium]
MNAARPIETREQILQRFTRLQKQHLQRQSQVTTKEALAAQREERSIVDAASTHTVENIVKGLADLQLTFDHIIEQTALQLAGESDRLAQLRQAIQVETARLARLNEIQVAADALDILTREQADQSRQFDAQMTQESTALDTRIDETREKWSREADAFARTVAEEDTATERSRQQEASDYTYNRDRRLKMEADAFAQRERQIAREHTEEAEVREADWTDRRALLAAQAEQHKTDLARIAAFPALLEQTQKDVREAAIKKADRQARIEAELLEEEVKSNRKVFAFQVDVLQKKIDRNDEEIAQLEMRLAEARGQAQALAAKAVSAPTPALAIA